MPPRSRPRRGRTRGRRPRTKSRSPLASAERVPGASASATSARRTRRRCATQRMIRVSSPERRPRVAGAVGIDAACVDGRRAAPASAVQAPMAPAPDDDEIGARVDVPSGWLTARATVPRPSASARRRIASAKTTSARPDTEVGRDDPAARAVRVAVADRLAEGGRRVRVAVEQPGVAVGQELAAIIDEEQGGVAGDVGGAVASRSRPGTTSASGGQPVGGHRPGARTGPNDAAVITTSAPATASRASGATTAEPMPGVAVARVGRAPRRASGWRSRTASSDAGQEVPEDRRGGCGPGPRRR